MANSKQATGNGESAGLFLQTILDASPVGIAVFDKDVRVLYANALAERLFDRNVDIAHPIRCGDFIGCANRSSSPEVCGHTRHCPACPLYNAICGACSREPGQSFREGEAFLDREPGLAGLWVKYRVVPALIDGRGVAVMAVEDITDAKANEAKLQSALTELSVIHEHAPVIMMLVDKDRRVLKANGFAARFADQSAEEMTGLPGGEALRCLHHLDDPRGCGFGPACASCRVREAVLDTLETGVSQEEVEAWLPFVRGETVEDRCLLISTAYLTIEGAERVLVCARDITDRKRSEQALRQSEKRHRSLFNSIRDAILVADIHRTIIEFNPAFIDLFGYLPEEILGRKTRVIYRNEDEFERMGDAIRGHMGDPAFLHTIWYKKKDGSVFPGDTSVFYLRNDEGDIAGFIGLIRDISERVQTENAMRLRTRAIESATDGIAILDENETYVYLNPAHAEMYGYDRPENLIGKSWRMLYSEDELKRFDREVMPDFRKKGFWRGEATGMKRDGDAFPQEISLTSLSGTGLICIVRDISDRIHAQETRKKLEAQLTQAQKMESVGRLAGGVAHDYNNMLSVIIGYTEMALDKTGPENPLRKDLEEVLGAAHRSTNITRQLLGFARQQTTDPKVLDLNETVAGVLNMLRRFIGEDIHLSWRPGPGPMTVFMDPSQLDQVLANLCINARDAIGGVGQITIETGCVRLDADYCAEHAGFIPGDFILLAVSDDGCGMDKETLANVFEPFFTTKGLGEGTGLGLATVYGIVKQNKGFINGYSEPGKGTTFKIYLPPHEKKKGPAKAREMAELPAGRGETVLIVEDESSILELIQMVLERLGYHALAASTPGKAMALAEEHAGAIDLLVTDVVMPEMNGRELAETLQSTYPDLKVLFMSGYTANVIAHRGVLEEGVHFIQKPASNRELAVKVREALEG